MEIQELINTIGKDAQCRIFPARGIPVVRGDLALSKDILDFYQVCGGAELFASKPFGFLIVPPEEVVPANPVLLGNYYLQHKKEIVSCGFQNRTKTGFVVFKTGQRVSKTGLRDFGLFGQISEK